jgi:transcriptional regulator with XRE-family HTH domain
VASKQSIVIRLSKRVREERQSRGISQEKLGTLAGLHRTYIGMIERAEKNITISNLDKIAKALRLEAADLLK